MSCGPEALEKPNGGPSYEPAVAEFLPTSAVCRRCFEPGVPGGCYL